ncbi:unnamed protein product [Euphydryas editha]|uniref:CCHC-type domain-containing protein n=1 Tax=Euphydryas editha TaxID=104508 RepID=A0AAU9U7R7_EUPED|nr:unnamed protein product [Euphydryas editha]
MEDNLLKTNNDVRVGVNTGRHAQQAAIDEMAEKTRTEAWNRLENLISDLKKFVDEKPNIHKEVKRQLASVGTAFNRLRALETTARSRNHRPSVETRDAETSPISTASYVRVFEQKRIELVDTGSDGDGESTTDQMLTSRKSKRKTRDSPGTTSSMQKRKRDESSPLHKGKQPPHPGNKRGMDLSSGRIIQDPNTESPEWQLVKSKSDKKKERQVQLLTQPLEQPKKKRPRKSNRSNALIIRPKEKITYAEILTRVKKDVPEEQVRNTVDKIRKTAGGDLLIILAKRNTDGGKGLQKTIADLLKEDAEIVSKGPQEVLEIRDLDDTTTKEDVLSAIQRAAGDEHQIPSDAVKSVRNAFRGTKIALVTLAVPVADKLLGQHSKIRIGWVNCRIKAVERPTRCFKCWYYGHLSSHCKSKVDRSKNCIKCGEENHRADKCEKEARCALCIEKGNTENCAHIAGCWKCPVFRAASQEIKKKQNSGSSR